MSDPRSDDGTTVRSEEPSAAQVTRPLPETLAWWALLAVPVLVPLAVYPPLATPSNPYASTAFTAPKLLALGLLVALSLLAWAAALVRREARLRDVPTKWWMLSFLGLTIASTVTALNPTTAFFGHAENLVGALTFVICAAAFLLTTQLVTGAHRMRDLARAFALGGAAVAVLGLIQISGFDPLTLARTVGWLPDRAASSIGNPDFTGTYLVFPMTLALALGISERTRIWKIVAWASMILTGSALVLTMTRGAWLGALVGACLLAYAVSRTSARALRSLLGGLGAVAAILAASAAIPWVYRGFVRRVGEVSGGLTVLSSGRSYIWRDALHVIAQHPLLGVGPDSYRFGWFPVRSLTDVAFAAEGTVANDAHNIILTFAATLGVPATLAAVGLVAVTLAKSRSGAFTKAASADQLVYSGWWAATAALALSLLFSVNTIVAMVALTIGIAVLITPKTRPAAAHASAVTHGIAAATVVAALVFVAVPTMTAISDYTLARATSDPAQGLTAVALEQAPWNFAARNLDAFYASAFAVDALQNDDPNGESLFQEADRKTEALVAANPYEYDSYYTRARLLTDAGRRLGTPTLEDAVSVADAGLIVQPNGVRLRTQKALALLELKRYAEMVTTLSPVWEADPRYVPAGTLYAEALILDGKPADASKVLDVLRARFPNDAEVARVSDLLARSSQPAK